MTSAAERWGCHHGSLKTCTRFVAEITRVGLSPTRLPVTPSAGSNSDGFFAREQNSGLSMWAAARRPNQNGKGPLR
eukprot:1401010-Amphidinium_carterae.1